MEFLLEQVLEPITDEQVNVERYRRVSIGFDYTPKDYNTTIRITGRAEDQPILLGLKDTARDLKEAGITSPAIIYRDGNNVNHMLTADQFIELNNAGKVYVQEVYKASWDIKDDKGTNPLDYTDDKYWP